MISILLLTLKIIGIVILSILGLVLFLVLIILLVPFRYEADVSLTDKKPSGRAGVHWLCRLIQVHFSFGKDAKGLQIRIAGFLLGKKAQSQKASGKEQEKNTEEETVLQESLENTEMKPETAASGEQDQALLEEVTKQEERAEDAVAEAVQEIVPEKIQETLSQPKTVPDSPEHKETATEDVQEFQQEKPEETLEEKIEKIGIAIGVKADDIRKKLDGLNEKRLWGLSIWEYLQTDPMKRSVSKLLNNLLKILLHILPRKGKINLSLGFNNPATTGQVLGILAILYPRFKGNLSITPYFDRAILEGEVSLKGHIRLIVLVTAAVKTVLDKNIWAFIKKVRNGGK